MDYRRLLTSSLRAAPCGEVIAQIMASALAAVEPASAVRRHLRRDGTNLIAGEQTIDLSMIERVLLIGAGKAGAAMAHAAADTLGDHLTAGLVIVKEGHLLPKGWSSSEQATSENHDALATPHAALRLVEAGHPIPDERGLAASQQLVTLLQHLTPHDLVIALISGGGSALLTLPVPGVSLSDLQALTEMLLGCGASIGEINILRKHLDRLKGGGLARLVAPATLITLVLSDVVGSPLDIIASGPTVADPSSFADALDILAHYRLTESVPPAILAHLRRGMAGELPETPKPGDPVFERVHHLLVGDNRQAANAAVMAARAAGLHTLLLTTALEGEAREAGRLLAAMLREIDASGNPLPRPACIVSGGETTVTMRGKGHGGRNQELALAAALAFDGLPNVALVALASDGGDGPTDAAGAVVTGATVERARAIGLDPRAHLADNNAYPLFAALDDLLRPGPTGTNVNDLTFLIAW